MKAWLTGCDFIPAPGGARFDSSCKVHYYIFRFFPLVLVFFSQRKFLTHMCFIWAAVFLNAANDDESVATAAQATGWVVIQIGCVRVHLKTYKCVRVDILTGLCKLLGLIDVPARSFWAPTSNEKPWLQLKDSPFISVLIIQRSDSRPC